MNLLEKLPSNQLNKIPPIEIIQSELGKRSFYSFVKLCWNVVEPETEFKDGWHLRYLCSYLEACYRGEVQNLIINLPPRHAKSVIVDIFFPAWVWTNKPSKKFLYASHSEEIALRDSRKCRDLIKSDFYQIRWPLRLAKDGDTQSLFRNMRAGLRASFGVNSKVTGQGGDFIIVDDPLDAKDAYSDSIRESVNLWYDSAFSNRIANPKTVVKIVAMQRLHQNDLTGHILEKNNKWETLILPAYFEGKKYISSIGLNDPRKDNEPLWPEVYGEKELEDLKSNMSELMVASQLQQRPTLFNGTIYKKEWFNKRVDNHDIIARFLSWDTASSVKDTSAYSACVVGELTSTYQLFIKEVWRGKVEFPQLLEQVERLANKYRYKLNTIYIEDKSSGIQAVQSLKQASNAEIQDLIMPFTPNGKGDKVSRAFQASLWCENGSVLLPPPDESYNWLYDFEEELFSFPSSKKMDQVDAFNQLILALQPYLEEGYRNR
jgi:predicted phage terminase large subunit-like protein